MSYETRGKILKIKITLTFDSATINQTSSPKSGCSVQSSKIMMGSLLEPFLISRFEMDTAKRDGCIPILTKDTTVHSPSNEVTP